MREQKQRQQEWRYAENMLTHDANGAGAIARQIGIAIRVANAHFGTPLYQRPHHVSKCALLLSVYPRHVTVKTSRRKSCPQLNTPQAARADTSFKAGAAVV
ncbi:MAG: hypothetical protein GDYSWBUE_002143 [Candidatus Fervidibacterota bacterium]